MYGTGKSLFVIVPFLLGVSMNADAAIIISEIYQNTIGYYTRNQAIELQNTGAVPVDLTTLKLWNNDDEDKPSIVTFSSGADQAAVIMASRSDLVYDSVILPAGSFAVVMDRGFSNEEAFFKRIPSGTRIFTTGDTSLVGGASISASEPYRPVLLLDAQNTIIDSYAVGFNPDYGDRDGCSLERIFPDRVPGSTNWGFSISATGETMGKPNSLTERYHPGGDEAVLRLNYFSTNTLVSAIAGVPFPAEIFAITDGRINYQVNGRIRMTIPDNLDAAYTTALRGRVEKSGTLECDLKSGRSGEFSLITDGLGRITVSLSMQGYQTREETIISSPPDSPFSGELIITEIMFRAGSSGWAWVTHEGSSLTEADFLEFFNNGKRNLHLMGWQVAVYGSTAVPELSALPPVIIAQGEYFLFVQNSADFAVLYATNIPDSADWTSAGGLESLPADSARVVIRDKNLAVVEAVRYSESYLGSTDRAGLVNGAPAVLSEGRFVSLERRSHANPSLSSWNWGGSAFALRTLTWSEKKSSSGVYDINTNSAALLATPGFSSSILLTADPGHLTVRLVRPLNILRNGEVISFLVETGQSCSFDVRIFSIDGRFLSGICRGRVGLQNSANIINFNGYVNGDFLPPGAYLAAVEAVREDTGSVARDRTWFLIGD